MEPTTGRIPALLGVRAAETEMVGRLFAAATTLGFGLVFFFSGSNALFVERVGSEHLPWVYLTNALIVIAGGLAYAAWSRRRATVAVLRSSTGLLTVVVATTWGWNAVAGSPEAAFAAAVLYRFLFIFALLGLWEVASAQFDVRQSKRLVPVVALGMMLAFMIGGAMVTVVTRAVDTANLLAVSAIFFGIYVGAFGRATAGADFDVADKAAPATPATILADPFARTLAAMRSLTILMVFIGEFVFYQQVQANLDSEREIAVFLGLFLAGATLTMVIVTATFTARFLLRFGVGVGLATMPIGLLIGAVALVAWGVLVGDGTGLFVIAILVNLSSMVLGQAIETPAGAVVYQPMPVERRIPIRVAVDGWLGSAALFGVGILILVARALGVDETVPVAGLLAAVAVTAVVVSRRLFGHYQQTLEHATTVAFQGRSSTPNDLREYDVTQGEGAELFAEDPGAALALAPFGVDLAPISAALPELAHHPDDSVAVLAIEQLAERHDGSATSHLAPIVEDPSRSIPVRAVALRALHGRDAEAGVEVAERLADEPAATGELDVVTTAVLAHAGHEPAITRVDALVHADSVAGRERGCMVLAMWPGTEPFVARPAEWLRVLLADPEPSVQRQAIEAGIGRFDAADTGLLLALGADPILRRSAVTALAATGADVLAVLDRHIDDLPDDYMLALVDGVYAPLTRRPRLLHQFLEPSRTTTLRRAGFDAIRVADIEPPATIDRMMRDDVDWARLVIATWRDVDPGPNEALALALTEEFDSTRQTLWAALRAKGTADRVGELQVVAARAANDDRANAIEALDGLLARPTRDLVVPILEPDSIAEALEATSALPEALDPAESLRRLYDEPRAAHTTRRLIDHLLQPDQDPNMSTILERVVALKAIDIFSTLPYSLLNELAQLVEERTFDAGDLVVAKDDPGDELFALTEGELGLRESGHTFSAGSALGELAILDPGPRTATITATTQATVLVISREVLLALADRHPELMAEIARVLASRLRSTTDQYTVIDH